MIDNTAFSKKATGTRFLTFQVRRVRDTTARRAKQTMPDQGATERRESLRGVSKGEVDSIRARERSFTVFPQISDVRKTGSFQKDRFPAKHIYSSYITSAHATEFWWSTGVCCLWLLCFRGAKRRMNTSQDEVCRRLVRIITSVREECDDDACEKNLS